MKPYIKIALFVVFLIALGGIFAALYLYNLKPEDLQNAKPHFTITAADFQKAFEDNEKAASEKYINKIIEVSGEIASVRTGEKNSMNVSLKTGSELSSVICTFHSVSDTTNIKPGNQIILRGVCSGFLMDVLLNNCAVIKISK
jgi:tRNA_anti-like